MPRTILQERNLGFHALDVCNRYCDVQDIRLLEHNEKNELNVKDLQTINDFLARIRNDRHADNKNKVDYRKSPKMQERVREVFQLLGPDIQPPKEFCWEGDALDRLEDSLANKEKLILQNCNMNYMLTEQDLKNKDRVVDIVREIIKQYTEHMRSCNRRPGH